jgi:hypothetical protein
MKQPIPAGIAWKRANRAGGRSPISDVPAGRPVVRYSEVHPPCDVVASGDVSPIATFLSGNLSVDTSLQRAWIKNKVSLFDAVSPCHNQR